MEFSSQLREHRQREGESWARDKWFALANQREDRYTTFKRRAARLLRRTLNIKTAAISGLCLAVLRFVGVAWVLLIPLIVLCLASLVKILLKKQQRVIGVVDYSGAVLVGKPERLGLIDDKQV